MVTAPYDRLINNALARLRDEPGSAEAYYVCGRLYALRFARQANTIATKTGGKLLPEPDAVQKLVRQESCARSVEEVVNDLQRSIQWLIRSVDEEPTNAVYHLALANIYRAGAHLSRYIELSTVRCDPMWNWYIEPKPPGIAPRASLELNWQSADTVVQQLGDQSHTARFICGSLGEWVISSDAKVDDALRACLRRAWEEAAFVHYYIAYELSVVDGMPRVVPPARGGPARLVAWECAQALTELCSTIPAEMVEVEASALRLEMQNTLRRLVEAGKGIPMSPIIVPARPVATVEECMMPDACVPFDISGLLPGSTWRWVRPEVGILVWDPVGSGVIANGTALIGQATWRMFVRDGFVTLDLLDDDRDGWLAADELVGLRVWMDLDSDGVSAEVEMASLPAVGIAALRVHANVQESNYLAAIPGVLASDGSSSTLFDWFGELCSSGLE